MEESILTFCYLDESSSIDSNLRRTVDVVINGIAEKHIGLVQNIIRVDEKYLLFKQSEILEDFIAKVSIKEIETAVAAPVNEAQFHLDNRKNPLKLYDCLIPKLKPLEIQKLTGVEQEDMILNL